MRRAFLRCPVILSWLHERINPRFFNSTFFHFSPVSFLLRLFSLDSLDFFARKPLDLRFTQDSVSSLGPRLSRHAFTSRLIHPFIPPFPPNSPPLPLLCSLVLVPTIGVHSRNSQFSSTDISPLSHARTASRIICLSPPAIGKSEHLEKLIEDAAVPLFLLGLLPFLAPSAVWSWGRSASLVISED